ncbi:MAG: glycerate kinase [Solobacterium sp.]|jgi:hydroxypyruvate reductase|nr:glycerate kinase [Solobacterium sp.]MCH4222112.1 glycerate kinase [Solobacterium sp.]MCH4265901.1 glycerate kinase [Solobacterium sp.]
MTTLREDAKQIIRRSIAEAMPDQAVRKALRQIHIGSGKLILVAVGKAGWQMASAASLQLGDRITAGICITKYDHVKGDIPNVRCYEAGHPVPDANSITAARQAEFMVQNLSKEDTVLMLISGGGSALFEDPKVPLEQLQDLTEQMLACGADITEINVIRKRLSNVKGGRFAEQCKPARVYSIILSDVIGDQLDLIASGPTVLDHSTTEQAEEIVRKYHLHLSEAAQQALLIDLPAELNNSTAVMTGSVKQLCTTAAEECRKLGYETQILTSSLTCEAREAGRFLSAIAKDHQTEEKSLAFICGGETVVHLSGTGKGGRNQELALSAAEGLDGLKNTALLSVGSDGTDGPTDAAGGYVDQSTAELLRSQGVSIQDILRENDAWHALKKCDGLIVTGPTGTNVNDLTVLLIKRN